MGKPGDFVLIPQYKTVPKTKHDLFCFIIIHLMQGFRCTTLTAWPWSTPTPSEKVRSSNQKGSRHWWRFAKYRVPTLIEPHKLFWKSIEFVGESPHSQYSLKIIRIVFILNHLICIRLMGKSWHDNLWIPRVDSSIQYSLLRLHLVSSPMQMVLSWLTTCLWCA